MKTALIGLVCLGLLACGNGDDPGVVPQATDSYLEEDMGQKFLKVGTVWGGDHARMEVQKSGAALEYDCAHGAIDNRIPVGSKYDFDALGYHVFDHGGPVRAGDTEDRHPARYTGSTDGKTLDLTVTLTDTKQVLGPYTLTLGSQGHVFKCL